MHDFIFDPACIQYLNSQIGSKHEINVKKLFKNVNY